MINENLHKKPAALDRNKHRALRIDPQPEDIRRVTGLNAFFVAAGEFASACKEFPLVWVPAGNGDDGKPLIAPLAVFGLAVGQNLCVEGDRWRTRYVPAMLRLYPFAMARTGPTDLVLCIDEDWAGFSTEAGQPLFQPDGTPTELTLNVKQQLENFEADVERTRLVGARLMDKGLLREMRFEATLPDGNKVAVEGFLGIDEDKLSKLSDAELLEFARSGILGLIHAQQISMGNMNRLAEWHAERLAAVSAAAPAAAND